MEINLIASNMYKKIIICLGVILGVLACALACVYMLWQCHYPSSTPSGHELDVEIVNSRQEKLSVHPFRNGDKLIAVVPGCWQDKDIKVCRDGKTFTEEKVIVEKSSVASLFVEIEPGDINYLNAAKSNEVSGEITILDKNGKMEYSGRLSSIHGRGNTTWTLAKKPYNIELPDEVNVLGLKNGSKFCLLANMCDESGVRNWIALDCARKLGMESYVGYEYANLYLNGHYNGLYLVTNKIDIDKECVDIDNLEKATKKANQGIKLKKAKRFSIDRNDTIGIMKGITDVKDPEDITGGYLLDFCAGTNGYSETCSGFITDRGGYVKVKSPKYATRNQVEYISEFFSSAMDAAFSPDGINHKTGKHYSEYFDVMSLVKFYLIQEALYNNDANIGSVYYYKKSDDEGGKMYAGPIWDFDLSLGSRCYFANCYHPEAFYANSYVYAVLLKDKEFRQKVIKVFNEELLPILLQYTRNGVLDKLYAEHGRDIEHDVKRWEFQRGLMYWKFHWGQEWNIAGKNIYAGLLRKTEYENVKDFLTVRTNFLREIWKDEMTEDDYWTVRVNSSKYKVKKGDCFTMPVLETRRYEFSTKYVDPATGKELNDKMKIMGDITVKRVTSPNNHSLWERMKTKWSDIIRTGRISNE